MYKGTGKKRLKQSAGKQISLNLTNMLILCVGQQNGSSTSSTESEEEGVILDKKIKNLISQVQKLDPNAK